MGNGHIRPHEVSGESCLTVTNTLVPYILSLIYAVPRVYRLSPTHSCHIHRFSCIRCLVTTVRHQHTRVVSCVSYVWCLVSTVHHQTHSCFIKCIRIKQFQSILISCNWLRPIHLTHLILRHHLTPMKRPRWHFCKHPHYFIRLISFELFVTITLPPLSRQGIEIIPYIKRFLEWIETLSLGGKLQSQKVLQTKGVAATYQIHCHIIRVWYVATIGGTFHSRPMGAQTYASHQGWICVWRSGTERLLIFPHRMNTALCHFTKLAAKEDITLFIENLNVLETLLKCYWTVAELHISK
jgi:hypothetical protein